MGLLGKAEREAMVALLILVLQKKKNGWNEKIRPQEVAEVVKNLSRTEIVIYHINPWAVWAEFHRMIEEGYLEKEGESVKITRKLIEKL